MYSHLNTQDPIEFIEHAEPGLAGSQTQVDPPMQLFTHLREREKRRGTDPSRMKVSDVRVFKALKYFEVSGR
jgi:hypothetical protein